MSAMSKDPVCGMEVPASQSAGSAELDGITYHFCCAGCRREFEAEPRRFVEAQPERPRVPCCGFGMVRHTTQRGSA